MSDKRLSHVDENGSARMVDVSGKAITHRRAIAQATVHMGAETVAMIYEGRAPKGDVLEVSRIAGIMAAKKTSDLIPLCHSLAIATATVDFERVDDGVAILAAVETEGPTGVEMEALTAASVAALTLYDMCKAVDRGMTIDGLGLRLKEGGKSGRWVRGESE